MDRRATQAPTAVAPQKRTTEQSSDEKGGDEQEELLPQNVRLRNMMMANLESAFQEVFQMEDTKLVPILNHRPVHLQLIKWDQLQMQLEKIEVHCQSYFTSLAVLLLHL